MLARSIKLFLIAAGILLGAGLATIFIAIAMDPNAPKAPIVVFTGGLILLGIFCLIIASTNRQRRAGVVLHHIEQAVRLNLPLPQMFHAIGESESWGFDRRMARARQQLEQGASLAIVLSMVPAMPQRLIELISAAERIGRLPHVLARIAEQRRTAIARGMGWLRFYRSYPPILLGVFIFVFSMFMILVMPKFETIFRDFNTKLPRITVSALWVSTVAAPWLLTLVAGAAAASVITIGMAWRRGAGFGLAQGPAGWMLDRLPYLGKMRVEHELGEVLLFTADALDSGRAINESLIEAARISPNTLLRERIERWMLHIQHGQALADAARLAGLPSLVCGMLTTTANTPDLAEVFRFLGRYYSARFSRAVALFEAAAIPSVAILMGLLVAWFALGIVIPATNLIDACIPYPTGVGL